MGADRGDVGGVDEMEAGIGAQPLGQPQPGEGLLDAGCEVAGGVGIPRQHPPAKHQGGKHRHDPLRQRMDLQVLQALGLGLDVFGAIGHRFGQELQIAVEDAGGGEIDHLLQPRRIEQGEQPLYRHHIHLLGPLRIAPGGGRVDHAGGAGDRFGVGLEIAQITHQQGDARIVGGHHLQLAGVA